MVQELRGQIEKSPVGQPVSQEGRFGIDILHLFVLCGFAVAQPLFDLISRNPEFLIAHRAQATDTIFLIAYLAFGIPTLMGLGEGVLSFLGRVPRICLHWVWVAILVALSFSPFLTRFQHISGYALIACAIGLGFGFTILYARFKPVRWFMTSLIPVIIVFPGLFLLNHTVFRIIFPEKNASGVYQAVNSTAPVVFIIFDEFPLISLLDMDLNIDADRFPHFYRFSRESFWFRNAITLRAGTEKAIPAILTGVLPGDKTVPTLHDHPNNLFTLMGYSYKMNVFETHSQLCPKSLCEKETESVTPLKRTQWMAWDLAAVYLHVVLPMEFREGLPVVSQSWKGFWRKRQGEPESNSESGGHGVLPENSDENRVELYSEFLNSITSAESTLYFLHIVLPHLPWEYLPSGKLYDPDSGKIPGLNFKMGGWSDDEWLVDQGYQRHLLQVSFVDGLLGKLVDRLEDEGIFDRSLIVITADHGANFWPNRKRRDVLPDFPMDIRNIPLFLKVPHQQKGVISDCFVENIDILPTLAAVLGISLPWPVDGKVRILKDRLSGEIDLAPCGDTVPPLQLTQRLKSLKRKHDLFGDKDPGFDLFKLGTHRNLLGQYPRRFALMFQSDIQVELDNEGFFQTLDLRSTFVPALISGRLHHADPRNRYDLAVVVNDQIGAVTRTNKIVLGDPAFFAVVPDSLFLQGKNRVDVFIIQGEEKHFRLLSTMKKNLPEYRLVGSNSPRGEHILSPSGQDITIDSHLFQSHLETVTEDKTSVAFIGWAADTTTSTPPDSIVVFRNGLACQTARIEKYRPDVAKYFNKPDLLYTGFHFFVPRSVIQKDEKEKPDIRVFALSADGRATELNYPQKYPYKRNYSEG